eukprot:8088580-Pyramimonas_sp.AAC.1
MHQWRSSHAHPPPRTAFRGPMRGLHREHQLRSLHAFPPPRTSFCCTIGSSIEGTSCAVRMRHPCPGQRLVPPYGSPPRATVAQFACVSPIQDNASWPHREHHRRHQWRSSHASLPPRKAFRGTIWGSTEGPSCAVRMRLPRPGQRFVAP